MKQVIAKVDSKEMHSFKANIDLLRSKLLKTNRYVTQSLNHIWMVFSFHSSFSHISSYNDMSIICYDSSEGRNSYSLDSAWNQFTYFQAPVRACRPRVPAPCWRSLLLARKYLHVNIEISANKIPQFKSASVWFSFGCVLFMVAKFMSTAFSFKTVINLVDLNSWFHN